MVLRTPVVTISDLPSTGVYGDPDAGTLTVTVTGAGATPTGTVKVGGWVGTLDANGQAEIDVSTVSVLSGVTDLSAQYLGDSVYGRADSNTLQYQTTKAGTSTEITAIVPAAPQYGDAVTVTVTVSALAPSIADPQGYVTLVVDGTDSYGPISFDPYAQDYDGR